MTFWGEKAVTLERTAIKRKREILPLQEKIAQDFEKRLYSFQKLEKGVKKKAGNMQPRSFKRWDHRGGKGKGKQRLMRRKKLVQSGEKKVEVVRDPASLPSKEGGPRRGVRKAVY